MLNDPFVHEQSRRFAERLRSFSSDDTVRIQRAYELLFARAAQADEIAAGKAFLASAARQLREDDMNAAQIDTESQHAYVRALFRLNEFVYLD